MTRNLSPQENFEDMFKRILKNGTLFRDEKYLSVDYLSLPLHRNNQLNHLILLYSSLITNSSSKAINQIIIGDIGVGKTVTVKYFGSEMEKISKKYDINIKYLHVNCRKEKTEYKVLIKILRSLTDNIPSRGFSPQDLLDALIDILEQKKIILLLVLDEIDCLPNENNLLYSLVRINDDIGFSEMVKRINIIAIAKDLGYLTEMFKDIRQYFSQNCIQFRRYDERQIFDILKQRIELGLKKNIISDELIERLSKLVYANGDIRFGLNILWSATKIAESRNLKYIPVECLELALQELVPMSISGAILEMSDHKLLLMCCAGRLMKNNMVSEEDNHEASFRKIFDSYEDLCKELFIAPRSYSQIWNYIQEFKKGGVITVKVVSEDIRGRKMFIGINGVSAFKFTEMAVIELETRGYTI